MTTIPLNIGHLQEYRALMLEAYTLHPDAFTSTPGERASLPDSWWEKRLQTGPAAESQAFGVEVDGALVATAALTFETRIKSRHKSTLVGMYVRDACRGLGLGGKLVEAVLAAARERDGVRLVQLTVSDNNAAAKRLYQKHGFVPFGVEPFAMRGVDGFVAKCHMWCSLSADDAGTG